MHIITKLYLLSLLLSALGAVIVASFDAPYGALVELEAALYSVLGGLVFYPLVALAAQGRRGLRRSLGVAALALTALLLLYPLYAALYRGYAEPGALNPLRYLAYAPMAYILTLVMGVTTGFYLALEALLRLLH